MKVKYRALSFLLSVMVMVTFMPAMAFAAEGSGETSAQAANPAAAQSVVERNAAATAAKAASKLTSVEFTSGESPWGYVGTEEAYADVDGAVMKLTYSSGTTYTYKYIVPGDEDEFDEGWYLNGNTAKDPKDLDYFIDTNGRLKEGNNECELFYWNDYTYEYDVSCKVNVTGIINDEIVDVRYEHVSGQPISSEADTWEKVFRYLWDDNDEDELGEEFKELEGDIIVVDRRVTDEVWNDEIQDYEEVESIESEIYTCQLIEDEDGYAAYRFAVKEEDEETGETWYDWIYPSFYDDQVRGEWTWLGREQGEVTVSVDGVDASTKLYVDIPEVKVLTSAELKLTDGFEPKVSIGQNDWIGSYAFAGEGNEFIIHYSDGSTHTYTYKPEWGDFIDEDGYYADFSADLEDQGIVLKKDEPVKVTFTFSNYDEKTDTEDSVKFDYTVTAKKTGVYTGYEKRYQYTGKVIKPKVIVKTIYGNATVPTSAYTYTKPKNKAIGSYGIPVTLLDTENYITMDDPSGTLTWYHYEIIPKKIKLSKVTAGKKSFTAKWSKLSKKNQKLITGIAIEYSTSKKFYDSKMVKVKKSAASKVIKKLKAKKTYYVRIYTYKTIKYTWYDENNKKHTGKYDIYSLPSKAKKVKTKK